ncbi:MAG TPA: glutaredoxin family protein [Chloroflexota bacterium]|jgi:thiol-disulfide isomerase/thioredoxin|nr:glutaredoxin family protein [Chloroflexota bacterium]
MNSAGQDTAAVPLEEQAIVIYGKPGCCLCDDAKPLVLALAAEFGLAVQVCNILDDAALLRAYRYRIPVVCHRGAVLDEGRVTAAALRGGLQRVRAAASADQIRAAVR